VNPGTEPSATSARAPARATYKSPTAWITLTLVLVLGLAADLGTKYWAFRTLAPVPVLIDREAVLAGRQDLIIPSHEPTIVFPSVLEFKLVLNVGAVFGAGAGKRHLFVGVTIFAILFGLFLFGWWTLPRDRWAHVGIGLLLAGGLGNLYDRLMYACVRDFIHPFPGVKLPFGWRYPSGEDQLWPYVSNIADKWLLVGIAILLVHAWRMGGQEEAKLTAAAAPDPAPAPKDAP
jgi:signal peptidase II